MNATKASDDAKNFRKVLYFKLSFWQIAMNPIRGWIAFILIIIIFSSAHIALTENIYELINGFLTMYFIVFPTLFIMFCAFKIDEFKVLYKRDIFLIVDKKHIYYGTDKNNINMQFLYADINRLHAGKGVLNTYYIADGKKVLFYIDANAIKFDELKALLKEC